ncbi:hypothetical protein BCO26_1466 [Heyndrickxia coagulans 2-6]|nr:hypothetical protein BCO26_1466 [Heyndrickxia coagulans 2-6]
MCAGRPIPGQGGKKLKIPGRPLKGVPGLFIGKGFVLAEIRPGVPSV